MDGRFDRSIPSDIVIKQKIFCLPRYPNRNCQTLNVLGLITAQKKSKSWKLGVSRIYRLFSINFVLTWSGPISISANTIFNAHPFFCSFLWEMGLTPETLKSGIKWTSCSNKEVVALFWSLHFSLISLIL